jgi:hypothetical protein
MITRTLLIDEHAPRIALLLTLAAIVVAVFGRLLGAFGLPGAITFVHYPLIVIALIVTTHPTSGFPAMLSRALLWFSGWVVVASLANFVSPLRAMLTWLVWVEPVLVLYVVLVALPSSSPRLRRLTLAVFGACVAGQFILMTLQIPRRAFGADEMQGTFVGSGTGAHTAPSLILLGAILFIGTAFDNKKLLVRGTTTALALAAFGLSILGAARAVVAVVGLAIGGALLWLSLKESSRQRRPLVAVVAAVLVGIGVAVGMSAVLESKDAPILEEGLNVKLRGIFFLGEHMSRDPASVVIGLGPGNSVSRVALETPDARLNPDSPIAGLGLETAPVTRAITEMQANAGIGGSSLFSPWTSLVGVFGDLGIVGIVLYLALWWPVVRMIRESYSKRSRGQTFIITATLLTAIGLGTYQIFLEDPGFALPAALLIGIAFAKTTTSTYAISSSYLPQEGPRVFSP